MSNIEMPNIEMPNTELPNTEFLNMELSNIELSSPPMKTETNATQDETVVCSLNKNSSTTFCKICLTGESSEKLLQPCLCKGTIGNIHFSCLERWINECGVDRCELCLYQFGSEHSPQYTVWRSIAIWIRHPAHRTVLYSEITVMLLMTLVFAFLVISLLFGMNTYQSDNYGRLSYAIGNSFFGIFLVVITLAYTMTMYSIIKDITLPWYRWWKNCNYIRLNRERLSSGPYP